MRAALREWISRLAGLFGRSRADHDFEQELQAHLEMVEENLRRRGLSPEAAAREARLSAGRLTQTMEVLRDSRGVPPLSTLWLDTKLGLRMLRKHWQLTLIGGLTLSVSMAIGASVFNLVNVIRGTSLPLEEGDRVVIVQPFDPETRQIRDSSRDDFERWRTALRSVANLSGFRTLQRNLISPTGPPASVTVAEMSASGFHVLRIAPALGRFLLPEDEAPSAAPVLVIGHDVWRARFSANPQVLGQQVRLDGVSHTIVGVMPRHFAFPVNHRYWTPLRPGVDRVVVFARLASHASLDAANAEARAMGLQESRALAADHRLQARVVPYVSGIGLTSGPEGAIMALLPFVLPLLIVPACANIAILIYARTVARQAEFAARTALGASRGRIVAQILVEVLLLAAGSAGVALLLASKLGVMMKSLVALPDQPFWMDFGLSYQTMLFAAILAAIAAMIAGGIPAIRATGRWQRSGIHALRGGSNPRLGKMWTAVVVAQIALSVAAVPTVSEIAWNTMRPAILGPGFDARQFLTARLAMNRLAASDGAAARFTSVRDELTRKLKAEPGITAVTMSETVPFEERSIIVEVDRANTGGTAGRESVSLNLVDDAFFDAFHIPLMAGRWLNASDVNPSRGAVVVNRSFALRVLGGGNPSGRRVRVVDTDHASTYEIVGLVGDLFAESRIPTMYRPLSRDTGALHQNAEIHQVRLTLSAGGAMPPNLAARVREIAAELHPALLVDDFQTLDEIYWLLSVSGVAGGALVAGLTLCAVLFSVAGIYTSMAFALVERRREVGIRAALGAPPVRLIAGAFRQVLLPVAIGVALGGVAAVSLEYYLSPFLFDSGTGGRPLPWILPAAEAFVLLVAAIALCGPVRRALRADPYEALRES